MSELIPWEHIGTKKDIQKAGMLIDLRRCIGCHACSVACKTEHEVPLGGFRMRVRYMERPDRPTLSFVPMMCMHCEDAPCLNACPTQAISRLDDGRVVINTDRCNGNKACITACPYGAIYIDPQTNTADKCDFCTHRTEVGLDPACVNACPTDALKFADVANPDDAVTQIAKSEHAKPFKEEAGTKPVVFYVQHEPWMEKKANLGVQLSQLDEDITYEQ